jgi:uracil-DNA glycosylase
VRCPTLAATRSGQLLVAPRLVVTLGVSATSWFLGRVTLAEVRGAVHRRPGVSVLPTYHPAAALRGGPRGEPMRLLRHDLQTAAGLVR